ncbi:hypothetical protein I4F81_008211 [Pyropia yezoensis]|uniref:Uncharacterized protein n=1 Tax=Pyropia yezoensis TaxID=2788 RepID=A0ACC3C5V3_PYRYE|nr:hypothetical protein I4F81_008211 [Neopyropia yezoensis]
MAAAAVSFVAAAPVLSRRGWVGAPPLGRESPLAGAVVTMRVSKAMPKGKSKATAAPKTTRKRSKALPFVEAPEGLKESQDGYLGFDPFRISDWLDQDWAAKGELKNGRVAMLACVGWIVAEFLHLPDPQFSNPVALRAMFQINWGAWVQILLAVSIVEILTLEQMYEADRRAGDLNWDPLFLDSPEMRLKEVKHARLAMLGILGLVIQQWVQGEPTIAQLMRLLGFA